MRSWPRPYEAHPRPSRLTTALAILSLLASLALAPAVGARPRPPEASNEAVVGSGLWLLAGPDLGSVGFGGDAGARGVEREAMLALRAGAGIVLGSRVRLGVEGRIRAKENSLQLGLALVLR